MAREDENLRGQEVRLERSERTLRQQRPAGRATQWRVILYHRPNSKPCSTSRVFCIMAREDENLRGQEVRLERSERTLRQQRPAGRATQWRVILYHRPNSKPCSTSRVFCIMAREDENLRGQEVRLERSERTLRQQRPAGRATQWRVILYHRPNSKPCSTSRVFCIMAREDENLRGQEVRLERSAIRQHGRHRRMAAQAPYPAYRLRFIPACMAFPTPTFGLHFVYKKCAPLPTDC